jgi:hypothetical protein
MCFQFHPSQFIAKSTVYKNFPLYQITSLQRLWSHSSANNRKALGQADLPQGNRGNIGDDSGRKRLSEVK